MDWLIQSLVKHASENVGWMIVLSIVISIVLTIWSIGKLWKFWMWLHHRFKKPQEQTDKAQNESIDALEERVTELERVRSRRRKK